ncbi:hypothetical protein [Helicobacter cetorum]|uniref:hypothetical protein n=1 Tax=Helicobacter cetorum TaxID=138563 RepID=UPI0002D3AB70|nr:hypothetical protein [Helicobacter cetorum]
MLYQTNEEYRNQIDNFKERYTTNKEPISDGRFNIDDLRSALTNQVIRNKKAKSLMN